MGASLRFLHLHSTFTLGGKEARAVRLMNAFGDRAEHVIWSAMPGALAARDAIHPGIAAAFPSDHPPLTGRPSLARYRALARAMRGFDLVLSYNWGAMDGVMARRLFGGPPLVHHEDGFNADEASGLKRSRTLFRRIALAEAAGLVVPSRTLERIARTIWKQPPDRLHRIANGIPVARFAARPAPDAIPGFTRQPGELVVGAVAGLRSVKNLPLLVRAFAALPMPARLVIVGEGPEREVILEEVRAQGCAERVHLPGFLPDPSRYMGLFDLFALSSMSEQFPIGLIEAMAAGLPLVATDVGDVAAMVAAPNLPFVIPPHDTPRYARALMRMASDSKLRAALGAANLAKAQTDYGEDAMIARYAALYARIAGRPDVLE